MAELAVICEGPCVLTVGGGSPTVFTDNVTVNSPLLLEYPLVPYIWNFNLSPLPT